MIVTAGGVQLVGHYSTVNTMQGILQGSWLTHSFHELHFPLCTYTQAMQKHIMLLILRVDSVENDFLDFLVYPKFCCLEEPRLHSLV